MKKTSTVAEALSHLLADTYLLYLKTQNFHWNVKGPHFISLHLLFETQYEQLSEAADVIAERIRALRSRAPGSFAEFLKLTSLTEAEGEPSANDMVATLVNDHEAIAASLISLFSVAEEFGDEATMDMLIQRKTEHDKAAWMLRSTLDK